MFVAAGTAIADTLFYEFIRAESELVVTGGFAGVNDIYAIEGLARFGYRPDG